MLEQAFYMIISGATLPMFSIIFGNVLDALGGSPTIAALVHQVNKVSMLCKIVKLPALVLPSYINRLFDVPGMPVLCVPGNCSLFCVLCRGWALDVDRLVPAASSAHAFHCAIPQHKVALGSSSCWQPAFTTHSNCSILSVQGMPYSQT